MSRLTRDGTTEPSRETKFSGANGDTTCREKIIFLVQLTTSRINGNLTRLIFTLATICDDHTYILRGYVQFNKYTYILHA